MWNQESSLPDSWTERIWATMRATYGAAFDRQWQCPEGADPVAHVASLKAVWGRELARFQQNPTALAYGLDNLPPYAPNLIEFRALCSRRPDSPVLLLSSVKADPVRVAQAVAALQKPCDSSPRAWAWRLKSREEGGERLTIVQRNAWREVVA